MALFRTCKRRQSRPPAIPAKPIDALRSGPRCPPSPFPLADLTKPLGPGRWAPERFSLVSRQFVEDRTIRAVIPVAGPNKTFQQGDHGLDLFLLARQLVDMAERKRSDLRTRPGAITPQSQEFRDLIHGKSEIAGPTDETQSVNIGLGVVAVTAVPPRSRRDQADLLIVADHLGAHPRNPGGFSDIHVQGPLLDHDFRPPVDVPAPVLDDGRRRTPPATTGARSAT